MLKMLRWVALISAVVFVAAMAAAIISSKPPIEPAHQQTAEKYKEEQDNKKNDEALWDRWFPDSISIYTLFLVVFTAVLAFGGLWQLNFLSRAERVASDSANAAKKSADVASDALVIGNRAFV